MKRELHEASPTPLARLRSRAFTLVELMVSVAILSLLLVMVFQMLDETQKTWSRAKGMVLSFKDARDGFEALNRTVSQATLNTYIGYDTVGNNVQVPKSFERKSELHFVTGPIQDLVGNSDGRLRYTHGIFFQAPLGYQTFKSRTTQSTKKDTYGELDSLLNGWGYYVEYASDKTERPQFLDSISPAVPERYRSRLMEFRQPAEATTIYQYHLEQERPKEQQKIYEWFRSNRFGVDDPANNDPQASAGEIRTTRMLADNIVALIISPRLSENDVDQSDDNTSDFRFKKPSDIAPEYLYDSRAFHYGSKTAQEVVFSRHQVPPVLRVTLIAIDEMDATRYAAQNNPKERPKYLPEDKWFKSVAKFADEMKGYTENLEGIGIRYRVFSSNIRMREGNFQKTR